MAVFMATGEYFSCAVWDPDLKMHAISACIVPTIYALLLMVLGTILPLKVCPKNFGLPKI